MFLMVCSVYPGANLLLKKPVNIDPAETLGTLFDRLPLEGQSVHQYYLLPKDCVGGSKKFSDIYCFCCIPDCYVNKELKQNYQTPT